MYDLESIQLPVKLDRWRFTETGNAILEVFVSEEHYNLFASKVFWEARFNGFLANLTLDGAIAVTNAFCVGCPYENNKVAWIEGNDVPDLLHLVFRVDGSTWQLLLQLYPLLKNCEYAEG